MYAIDYTDMAKHARRVVAANGVDHIVTVIQGGLSKRSGIARGRLGQDGDDEEMNGEGKKNQKVVDIIRSGEFEFDC